MPSLRNPLFLSTLALAAAQANAQGAPSDAAAAATAPAATTTIVVTGNPLRDADPALPASVLAGEALAQRRGATLGETLDQLPGVAATQFGPNASRPVIRGQDGDRIRVLSNSGASFDASALSFDHAVPLDPLVIERIEVLRGPAALLYGGSAVGGVVNALDKRIPSLRPDRLQARGELRLGGAAAERAAAVVLDAPLGGRAGAGWVLHADVATRESDDLRVPGFVVDSQEHGSQRRTRVLNSASRSEGGALGLAWAGADGHAGVALDSYRSRYGVVVEEDVTIHLQRERLAGAGEWRWPSPAHAGAIETLRWQAARTHYRHDEVEGSGEVGTTFANRGSDLRIEAVQRALPLAGGALTLRGVLGLQAESSAFAALGEEAFVPGTRSTSRALFALQSLGWRGGAQLSLGLRAESVRVASDGDAPDAEEPRFGAPQSRSFAPRSLALAARVPLAGGWLATAHVARSQRAPTSYELYANGVHLATATYERGDPQQRIETGRSADLGLQWRSRDGANGFGLHAFTSRFDGYIVLLPTGEPELETEEGERVPVMAFRGVPARLAGAELEGRFTLAPGLVLHLGADRLRGDNRADATPLPRIAPTRWRAALALEHGALSLRLEVQHAARQGRIAPGDVPTDGWTQWHADLAWALPWLVGGAVGGGGAGGGGESRLFVRARNLGNQLAFNATSIATVRGLSPLAGRSVLVGLRLVY